MARAITARDEHAMRQAVSRQERLTKPAGSRGRLEELSIRLAGMTGWLDPPRRRIGGATGDVCGAIAELGQLATLLVFAVR